MSQILGFLEDEPPRCLKAFDALLVDQEGDDYTAAATFAIRCKSCGSDTFHLRAIMRSLQGGGRLQIGARATCTGCSRAETLIDVTRAGHDAELGRIAHLAGADEDERQQGVGDDPLFVNVQVIFNNEVRELLALGRKHGCMPQDLFDGVALSCRTSASPWRQIWDFECA